MWRISAATVTGLPIIVAAITRLYFDFYDDFGRSTGYAYFSIIWVFMGYAFIGLYVIARVILLVLSCIALRALPAAAFIEIQWVSFFPHIG